MNDETKKNLSFFKKWFRLNRSPHAILASDTTCPSSSAAPGEVDCDSVPAVQFERDGRRGEIRVLIINGSPRAKSNTMVFADRARVVIESMGGHVTTYNLGNMETRACTGCWSDDDTSCVYPCKINDDLTAVFADMVSADGVIFVSGVYWFGVTSTLKALIDRMTCLWKNGSEMPLLNGKAVAFMSTSVEEGNVAAMAPLMATCTFMGMHILPYGLVYGNINEGTSHEDGWGLDFSERCGRNMILMIRMIRQRKVEWW